MIDSFILVTLH